MEAGVEVGDVLKDVSIPPKFECKKFRSIWALGFYFQVASYETRLETQDFGGAATFRRPWQASARDRNVLDADVEYIGQVKEIVELDYRGTCIVVLVCRWVKLNYWGPNAMVKKDKWGFTLANFNSCSHFGRESFAFPRHCQ